MTPQKELFKAETAWFHIFKTMIDNGDVARMGPYAVTVYLVIKSHTNFATGRAFPALETIAEKSGVSLAQVKRELKTLEKYGYITTEKKGRANHYTLGKNRDPGRVGATFGGSYLGLFARVSLGSCGRSEERDHDRRHIGARVVHIERLTVNVANAGGGAELQRVEHPRGRPAKNRRPTQKRTL